MKILLRIGDENLTVNEELQTELQADEYIKNTFTEGAKIAVKVLKNDENADEVEFAEFDNETDAKVHIAEVIAGGETVHVPVTDEETTE